MNAAADMDDDNLRREIDLARKGGALRLRRRREIEVDQRRGAVYFVACDNRFVKVGFAADVAARLAELQTGCPFDLKILGALKDVHEEVERWFHAVLRHEHVRGEWFNLTERVRLLIHAINLGLAQPVDALHISRLYESCHILSETVETSAAWPPQ